jgi:uncharacterized membrane protein
MGIFRTFEPAFIATKTFMTKSSMTTSESGAADESGTAATMAIPRTKMRISSIDILRGLVMLIMAIDHIRDNFHRGAPNPTDLHTTTLALFFTRWITHFCAPAFVFLSGVSAYLAGKRRTQNQLGIFLIKRGLWLILLELTVITFAFFLDPGFHLLLLQVIWAIGGSMIILGLLVRLKVSPGNIGTIGAVIFFCHNLLDYMELGDLGRSYWWKMLWTCGPNPSSITSIGGGHSLATIYALLPWTGVMLLGYAVGTLYANGFDAARRKKLLVYSGAGMLVLFVILRLWNLYGDPRPWGFQQSGLFSVLSFFNVTKYPPSLLYLCMTLGPTLILLACTENITGAFARVTRVYGQVPFFYYVLHWYLIQALHLGLFFAMGFTSTQIVNPKGFFRFHPQGYGVSLAGVYVVWLVVIVLLYWPCKWYGRYKLTHRQWWLSYL